MKSSGWCHGGELVKADGVVSSFGFWWQWHNDVNFQVQRLSCPGTRHMWKHSGWSGGKPTVSGPGAQPSILTHISQTCTAPRVASENEEGVSACANSRVWLCSASLLHWTLVCLEGEPKQPGPCSCLLYTREAPPPFSSNIAQDWSNRNFFFLKAGMGLPLALLTPWGLMT